MGDISEMRGLIVVATIVSVTVALVLLMPTEFYSTAYNQDLTNTPGANDITELLAWNQTFQWNITGYNPIIPINMEESIGGYNYHIYGGVPSTSNNGILGMDTFAGINVLGQWVLRWDIDEFQWFNYSTHQDLSDYNILGDPIFNISRLDDAGLDPPYKLSCENTKTRVSVTFSFDNSTYTGFLDAYENDGLTLVFNVEWSERLTSINALSLIAMVLFGGLPGIDPVLNGIFAFIGWGIMACVAYLMFIFTLRIVGAVFGGGGA